MGGKEILENDESAVGGQKKAGRGWDPTRSLGFPVRFFRQAGGLLDPSLLLRESYSPLASLMR
jgi:hypothetical protein